MKTIICGGRNYQMTMADHAWLRALSFQLPITLVVSGGATGADSDGEAFARSARIPTLVFDADWYNTSKPGAVIKTNRNGIKYNVLAGHQRNQEMADYADACIVFPGGSGTKDMVKRAEKKGIDVIYRYPPFNPLDHEQTK